MISVILAPPPLTNSYNVVLFFLLLRRPTHRRTVSDGARPLPARAWLPVFPGCQETVTDCAAYANERRHYASWSFSGSAPWCRRPVSNRYLAIALIGCGDACVLFLLSYDDKLSPVRRRFVPLHGVWACSVLRFFFAALRFQSIIASFGLVPPGSMVAGHSVQLTLTPSNAIVVFACPPQKGHGLSLSVFMATPLRHCLRHLVRYLACRRSRPLAVFLLRVLPLLFLRLLC